MTFLGLLWLLDFRLWRWSVLHSSPWSFAKEMPHRSLGECHAGVPGPISAPAFPASTRGPPNDEPSPTSHSGTYMLLSLAMCQEHFSCFVLCDLYTRPVKCVSLSTWQRENWGPGMPTTWWRAVTDPGYNSSSLWLQIQAPPSERFPGTPPPVSGYKPSPHLSLFWTFPSVSHCLLCSPHITRNSCSCNLKHIWTKRARWGPRSIRSMLIWPFPLWVKRSGQCRQMV